MKHCKPHFHLISEANADNQPGRWRFVLQANDTNNSEKTPPHVYFEAGGTEEDVSGERLELLCVVRGLEALDQPSRVTLVTASTYVREGIRYGLEQWRENGWQWESFGRMVPVKNQDLWQRVDIAMQFHRLECLMWRFDAAHESASEAVSSEICRETEKAPNRQWMAVQPIDRTLGLCQQAKKIATQCLTAVRQLVIEGASEIRQAVRA